MSKEFILSTEQKLAIEYSKPKAYAIKGIAGSGKTTVGIHRIPYLLNKCTEEDDSVLVVTFHKTLVNFLEHLVKEQMRKSSNQIFNFQSSNWLEKLKVISIDDLMDEYYLDYLKSDEARNLKYRFKKEVSNQGDIQNIFKKAYENIKVRYSDVNILKDSNIDFLLEEVQYLVSNRIDKLRYYQGFTRKGRNRFRDKKLNIEKKSKTRKAIFELRDEYIRLSLTYGVLDRFIKRRLALKYIESHQPKNVTHLIVDEAQDLDKVRFDFLKQFINENKTNSSATFLYDPNQSIHAHSWLGNGHTFKELGIDIRSKNRSLSKNFRTTYEIQDAAISIFDRYPKIKDSIDIKLTNKSNAKPIYGSCLNKEEQTRFVINIVKNLSEILELKDIIIAGKNRNSLLNLENELIKHDIECSFIKPRDKSFGFNKIRLMTLYATKGLECQAIILIDLNEGILPGTNASEITLLRERKLLYVSMTRATKYLYLVSSGNKSSFITEIDEEKIISINTKKIPDFIPVEDPTVQIEINSIMKDIEKQIEESKELLSIEPDSFKDKNKQISDLISLRIGYDKLFTRIKEILKSLNKNSLVAIQLSENIKKLDELLTVETVKIQNKLSTPISIAQIEEDLRSRYNNFSEKTIITLATARLKLKQGLISGESDKFDYGPDMVHYSKALEMESKAFLKKNNISIYTIKYGKKIKKKFYEYMDILLKKNVITKEQRNFLNRFSEKRNDGSHEDNHSFEVFKKYDEILFKDGEVFEKLNNLLE